MYSFSFFCLLLIFSFGLSAQANPLLAESRAHKDTFHEIQPRVLEEIMLGRWHLMFEDLLELFIAPPDHIAFWGFGTFLRTVRAQVALHFSQRPPSPHYSITMGFLQLYAEDTVGDNIRWEVMDWLLGRLLTFWENGWNYGEFDALLTDMWTNSQVHVTLRVLLDRPLTRR